MKLLVLGGIAESKQLAKQLLNQGMEVIYSIVGLVRQPELDCELHIGGFSEGRLDGIEGMVKFLIRKRIDLIVDATHPYATDISSHAVTAGQKTRIPCWRYHRAGWDLSRYTNWQWYGDWDDLMEKISRHKRPFFSIGRSALDQRHRQPESQHWVVRSAIQQPPVANVTMITAVGPFDYREELRLMKQYQVDALITKDSGCHRVQRKLDAAMDLGIPVYIQSRPELPEADRCFDQPEDLVAELAVFCHSRTGSPEG